MSSAEVKNRISTRARKKKSSQGYTASLVASNLKRESGHQALREYIAAERLKAEQGAVRLLVDVLAFVESAVLGQDPAGAHPAASEAEGSEDDDDDGGVASEAKGSEDDDDDDDDDDDSVASDAEGNDDGGGGGSVDPPLTVWHDLVKVASRCASIDPKSKRQRQLRQLAVRTSRLATSVVEVDKKLKAKMPHDVEPKHWHKTRRPLFNERAESIWNLTYGLHKGGRCGRTRSGGRATGTVLLDTLKLLNLMSRSGELRSLVVERAPELSARKYCARLNRRSRDARTAMVKVSKAVNAGRVAMWHETEVGARVLKQLKDLGPRRGATPYEAAQYTRYVSQNWNTIAQLKFTRAAAEERHIRWVWVLCVCRCVCVCVLLLNPLRVNRRVCRRRTYDQVADLIGASKNVTVAVGNGYTGVSAIPKRTKHATSLKVLLRRLQQRCRVCYVPEWRTSRVCTTWVVMVVVVVGASHSCS